MVEFAEVSLPKKEEKLGRAAVSQRAGRLVGCSKFTSRELQVLLATVIFEVSLTSKVHR